MRRPKIAVLVLNYNGARFLRELFRNLKFLENSTKGQVFLIDNASADDSELLSKEEFPWIKFQRNDHNYGWGEGYNKGIEGLGIQGQFTHYIFLNNDTEPDETWFEELYKAASTSDEKVAEWGCRTVFAEDILQEILFEQLERKIYPDSASKNRHHHYEFVGDNVFIRHEVLTSVPPVVIDIVQEPFRGYAIQLYNPYGVGLRLKLAQNLGFKLLSQKPLRVYEINASSSENAITIPTGERFIFVRRLRDDDVIPPIVQNNGIGINSKFEGYDLLFYKGIETKLKTGELKGICGVSKMVRSDVFHKLGGFDSSFFMYYEDVDFSLTLQEQGYTIQIVDQSILRHHHGGSSNTQSLFFARQVAWSRLYFQWKHAPFFRKFRTLLGVAERAYKERLLGNYESENINVRAFVKLKDRFPNDRMISLLSRIVLR